MFFTNKPEVNTIEDYYSSKIQELELKIKEKELNFMRLQAKRNDLNGKVIKLKEELLYLLRSANKRNPRSHRTPN